MSAPSIDEIFAFPPNWGEEPEFFMKQNVDVLDLANKKEIDIIENWPKMMMRYSFLGVNRTRIHDIEEAFKTRRGRLSDFYIPSWFQDLKLTEDIEAADATLPVESTVVLDDYKTNNKIVYIAIIHGDTYDPTLIAREVTDIAVDSIAIDSAIGVDLPQETLICILHRVRFDQDEIEWEYKTTSVASVKLTFKEIE